MYLPLTSSDHLSIYLPIYLSIHPFVHLSANLFSYLSIPIYLSTHLHIYPSIHPSIHPSTYPSPCVFRIACARYPLLSRCSGLCTQSPLTCGRCSPPAHHVPCICLCIHMHTLRISPQTIVTQTSMKFGNIIGKLKNPPL